MVAGYFTVPRGWRDMPALRATKPLTRCEAWLWMREEAAWRPRSVNAQGHTITVQRGSFCHSLRHLAKEWGWSKTSVENFLVRLARDGNVVLETRTGQTEVTISDYDQYPDRARNDGTASGQNPDTAGTNKKKGKREAPKNKHPTGALGTDGARGLRRPAAGAAHGVGLFANGSRDTLAQAREQELQTACDAIGALTKKTRPEAMLGRMLKETNGNMPRVLDAIGAAERETMRNGGSLAHPEGYLMAGVYRHRGSAGGHSMSAREAREAEYAAILGGSVWGRGGEIVSMAIEIDAVAQGESCDE